MLAISLADALNIFVSHRADWFYAELFRKKNIARSNEIGILEAEFFLRINKLANHEFLRLRAQPSSHSEFGKLSNRKNSIDKIFRLGFRTLNKIRKKRIVILRHSKINFVHNRERGNFVERSVEPSARSFDEKSALIFARLDFKIFKTRMPKPQKIDVVAFDPFDVF